MNKGRLIGGGVCLAVAVLLAVLMYALPENEVVFMVDNKNLPIIPIVVLGLVGFGLVTSAVRR